MGTRNKSFWTKAGWLLFYLYIVMLCYFLFFSEHYGRTDIMTEYKSNLVLFREIKRFIIYRNQIGLERVLINLLGNILAFAPFGFLLPMLSANYRGVFRIALLSLLFSLSVEAIQLAFRVGIFDVDDLLLNTIGGVAGYLFYKIVSLFSGNERNRRTERIKGSKSKRRG